MDDLLREECARWASCRKLAVKTSVVGMLRVAGGFRMLLLSNE